MRHVFKTFEVTYPQNICLFLQLDPHEKLVGVVWHGGNFCLELTQQLLRQCHRHLLVIGVVNVEGQGRRELLLDPGGQMQANGKGKMFTVN